MRFLIQYSFLKKACITFNFTLWTAFVAPHRFWFCWVFNIICLKIFFPFPCFLSVSVSFLPYFLPSFLAFWAAHVAYGSPRLGVTSELQMPSYATAMPDPSHVFDLHHGSQQCWKLNPVSGARDWACILIDTRWVWFWWATTRTPLLKKFWFPLWTIEVFCFCFFFF